MNDFDVSGHHGALSETDIWIVKLSFTTGINETLEDVSGLSLQPNPFSGTAYLNFNINTTDDISIELFDISGRLVSKILNEKLNKGSYSIDIDSDKLNLENGMYLIRISTSEKINTIKLIKN